MAEIIDGYTVEDYDVVILGTGLTECILSGLLSVDGKKVAHLDRNDYYGAESASLNLTQIYNKFRPGKEVPTELGRDRDWNIDLIPKFMMANGDIVGFLTHTDVIKYLEFKQIAGSFVRSKQGKPEKVPSNMEEAIRTPLVGIFEKRRLKKFLEWMQKYNLADPSTHQGLDIDKVNMAEVYYKFGLSADTQEFVGHAMALHLDDEYLNDKRIVAKDTVEKVKLYSASVLKYGKSPYIYPLYGLGDLPQAFSRLSAVYGGTFILGHEVDGCVYEDKVKDGEVPKITGVKCPRGDEKIFYRAKQVIGDPSYFPDKVQKTGSVVRAICILTSPVPNTSESDSVQIVIPQAQVMRKHDIYIACVGSSHMVSAKDHYLAIVSTIVETENPERELEPGLNMLGPIKEKFVSVSAIEEPIKDGRDDQVFISRSYDATSHFETVCQDVRDMWRRITGEELDLKKKDSEQTEAAQ